MKITQEMCIRYDPGASEELKRTSARGLFWEGHKASCLGAETPKHSTFCMYICIYTHIYIECNSEKYKCYFYIFNTVITAMYIIKYMCHYEISLGLCLNSDSTLQNSAQKFHKMDNCAMCQDWKVPLNAPLRLQLRLHLSSEIFLLQDLSQTLPAFKLCNLALFHNSQCLVTFFLFLLDAHETLILGWRLYRITSLTITMSQRPCFWKHIFKVLNE